ncbi:MAG: type II toxin-antitoxin system HicA family toxin [Oscillatoriales cyanobacterium]|nr:MAG: type II toxin-antitoxin system HicA family toxin [Oscillatoriales cyanobacterium]TAE94125.1 MAG: type II toxin-antitoxin system HicA family toxin [Oscillatoriales cyanobacterium]TAF17290.1 MAG: type II toxin-antitoxin system HicA family toxin [Oscillatoriales cyanobacterium]TAF38702.1 MAG: type II toxin-antitoxin system HicA family toxin [Oscillatoriales cyanobacterium]TAF58704.1 MAG: type II toxin-antitoxin system HicA family toxin [Oscillatoriales cyanobacterium]
MPPLKPVKRRDLIYYLKQLGFDGPYSGKRHQFMLKDNLRVTDHYFFRLHLQC